MNGRSATAALSRVRLTWAGIVLALLLAASLLSGAVPVAASSSPRPPRITVLSNRADLVAGGDALVEIQRIAKGPVGRVTLGGRDVTSAFKLRSDGRIIGLVTGMRRGRNVLAVTMPDGSRSELTITNHPISGPVFSGPHIQPWTCAPGALDANCNRKPTYTYRYKSTRGGSLRAYDPKNPPSDVATTKTDTGETVPFIVRQETGVIARDEYRIAVLYDPSKPWKPWQPQNGFNHKLVITHGASCDTGYAQRSAPDVLNEAVLARGYIVMSHALDNAGHNCNIITQAESLVMTKEYLVERYGELRYTIGTGCSGGALAQQQVANAYPGVYQGITPACSYPDAWSSAMQYVDYDRLLAYFSKPQEWERGVFWEELQVSHVLGHPNPSNPATFTTVIPNSGKPTRSCPGVPAEKVYNAKTNPDGVRCTLPDYMVNVFGRRPSDGFARRPAGNVGVQYGLEGLLKGELLPSQFVDVNTKIGGVDIDYNKTVARGAADPIAVRRAYRSGAVNTGSNLDKVAIIDLRGPDPGAFHDVYRTYALRNRLIREHGHAKNQMLWRGSVPLLGDTTFRDAAIFAMDRWLAAVEADRRDIPLARKIVEDRPDDVTHRCTDGAGHDVPATYCDRVVESYSTPRMAAEMPETDDVIACALKPLRRGDYGGVQFTDAQWAKLKAAFPNGVCDYTEPDPYEVDTVPWLTYEDGPGGTPLGAPPTTQFVFPKR